MSPFLEEMSHHRLGAGAQRVFGATSRCPFRGDSRTCTHMHPYAKACTRPNESGRCWIPVGPRSPPTSTPTVQKKTSRMKRAALKLKQAGRLHNCMHNTPSLLRAVILPSSRPVKILTNGTVHLVSFYHYSVTQLRRPFLPPYPRRLGLVLASARATLKALPLSRPLTYSHKPSSPCHA